MKGVRMHRYTDTAILTFIREFIDDYGYSPTVREIQSGLDISSTSVVSYYLKKLENRGAIHHEPGMARTIAVVDPARR